MACALVATWWTGPSQRRLFSSIVISAGNYQRWMNGVVRSRSKIHLLEYVRSLGYGGLIGNMYRMRDLPQHSGKCFSALRNLRSLTFFDTRVERISEEGFHTCFSAFQETLTYLSLEFITTSFSAFVTLVNYFPNATVLQLRLSVLVPDEAPVPTLSRPLRGKLHIDCLRSDCVEFFDRLAKLELEYEELVITSSSLSVKTEFLESALQISKSTVKSLRLIDDHQGEITSTDIPHRTTP